MPTHQKIDALAQSLTQGTVVRGLPTVIVAIGSSGSPTAEGLHTDHGIAIVTQTCDLVRSCAARPYFVGCPIVDLSDNNMLGDAQSKRSPRWAPLPKLGPNFFADLDVATTYQKSVLAHSGISHSDGLGSGPAARDFAACLARNVGRFPFPDDVQKALASLRNVFLKRASKNSPEGRAVDALSEVRVQPHGAWDSRPILVTVHFVFDDGWLDPTECRLEHAVADPSRAAATIATELERHNRCGVLAMALANAWLRGETDDDGIEVDVDVHDSADLSFKLVEKTEALDFDFLSAPAAGEISN